MNKTYKVSLSALMRAIKDDEDMVDLVERMVKTCISYVEQVDSMSHAIEMARFRCDDASDYREAVARLDMSRRRAHESLMSCVNAVLRLGNSLQLPLIPAEYVDSLESDRNEYYHFAQAVKACC